MKLSSFKIALLVLVGIVVFNGLNGALAQYPAREYEGEIQSQVGVGMSTNEVYTYQDHNFFSNFTNNWYFFWYDANYLGGALMCGTYDTDYTLISEQRVYNLSGIEALNGITDFDVCTDKYGLKVYVGFRFGVQTVDSAMYIIYGVTSKSTGIDFLAYNDVQHYVGRIGRGVDVFCATGGIIATMGFKSGSSTHGSVVRICNSTTNWDETYAWDFQFENVYLAKTGNNPPNDYYHATTWDHLGENGVVGVSYITQFWSGSVHTVAVLAWETFSWDYENNTDCIGDKVNDASTDYVGEFADIWNFDLIGSMNTLEYSIVWVAGNGGNADQWLNVRTYNHSVPAPNPLIEPLVNFGVDGGAWVHGHTNTREARTIVYNGDAESGVFEKTKMYVIRINNTSGDWGNSTSLWNHSAPASIGDGLTGWIIGGGHGYTLNWGGDQGSPAPVVILDSFHYDWAWFYLDNLTMGSAGNPPVIENFTLTNTGGEAVEWLFEGEVYVLGFDSNNVTENGYIAFSDGDDNLRIGFNQSQNRVWFNQSEEFKGSVIEHRISGSYSWIISFTLASGIDDQLDVDFSYYIENFLHNETATGSFINGLNIYNLGGFTMNRYKLNDAGWFPAGNPLEAYSQYNASTSWVNTSQVYRKIQHYHSQFSLDVSDNDVFDTKENTGDVEFHLQYYNGSGWYDVIYLAFDIPKGAVDPAGLGGGKAWIDIAWNWYGRNDAGHMSSAKNGVFTAYPDCGDDVSAKITTAQFWLDLWVDQTNNSRAVGGNFNPYYFGMDETGWILWNSWRPLTVNSTFATVTVPLRDNTGEIMQADNMDLMRIVTYVITGSASDTNEWSIIDFKNQDILRNGNQRLRGIDKPALVETLMVDMPSSGFMSGLRKAIQGIGTAISNALAGLWKSTIGLIDTILAFLGLPEGLFSSIIFVLAQMLKLFDVLIGQFETLVNYAVTSMTQAVLLVVTVAGRVVFFSIEFVTSILDFWNQLVSLFTGGWENVGNLWLELDILVWVQFWLVGIFPFWELDRMAKSDNGLGVLKEDVQTFWGLITGIFHIFAGLWGMLQQIFDLILRVVTP